VKDHIINGKSLQVAHKATGGSVRDTIHWKATSSDPITNEDAMEAMKAEGYSPLGYGFSEFDTWEQFGGSGWIAMWESQANCD
jgi:hypothetical protein